MNVRLADPWWLLAAVPVIACLLLPRRGAAPSLPFSSLALLSFPHVRSWRLRLLQLSPVFRWAWLLLLLLAMARPQTPDESSAVYKSGLGVILVIDVSGSMGTVEATGPQGPVTRLAQCKRFVRDWLGDDSQDGARRDRIGVAAFAAWPRLVCPLTTDHRAVAAFVDRLEIEIRDDRTDIGAGVAMACDGLRDVPRGEGVVVLCSDGAQRITDGLGPLGAARAAAALGIRLYTIGVGAKIGDAAANDAHDEETLKRMAEIAGGRFFRAADQVSLSKVAKEIDRLEPTAAALESFARWRDRFPEVIGLALVVWALEIVLRETLLRVAPAQSE